MSARKKPRQQSGWSTALRDEDDDSSSEPETSTTGSTPFAQGQQATKGTPDATVTYREGSDWDWNWAGDAVDIGLVPEPKELKFIETPFTLAKRNAKRTTSVLSMSTARSAPAAKSNDNSNRAKEVRPVQSSPLKPYKSPSLRQPAQKASMTTSSVLRPAPSESEPHAAARAPASARTNKRAPFEPDETIDRDKAARATPQLPVISSKSQLCQADPKALTPAVSGFRPAKVSARPLAPVQSAGKLPQQQVEVLSPVAKATELQGQGGELARPMAKSASSSAAVLSSPRLDESSEQVELFVTTLPTSEPELPVFLRSPTPAFQHWSSQNPIAQPTVPHAESVQSQSRPIKPVPLKPFVPPLRLNPARLASACTSTSSLSTAFARSNTQAQALAQSTPSARVAATSFYSKPDPASSPTRPVRSTQPHKQGISPETRKRLDRFKRIGNFGLLAGSTLTDDPGPTDSELQGLRSAPTAAAGPAASTTSARFTIPGLSTPLAGQKKRASRLAFEPDEPLEAFQARSGLKPFSSLLAGGRAHGNTSSGSRTSDVDLDDNPVTPTPSVDYQRARNPSDRERIVLGATVRSVRPITSSGDQSNRNTSRSASSARAKKGFKRPLTAARVDWEADYGQIDADGPSESEDAKRRRLYRSLGL